LFLLLSLRYKWHIYLSSNNAFTVFCSWYRVVMDAA
jgi:hypothetical protein